MNLTIIEILILLIPAIIIAVTVIIIVRYYYKHSENERRAELILKNQEITLPLRLQAYERMTLFLERISPDSLLMRHNQSNITSRQLHSILLTSIRNEFEHNLSQQIYMSPKAWELVKNARSQIIKVINTAALPVYIMSIGKK
mgnify:FL=1